MNPLAKLQLEASTGADLTFTVPIEPRGWARARRRGNVYYVDAETEAQKRAVAFYARHAMGRDEKLLGPLELIVISIMPIPNSWNEMSRAKALLGKARPASKPDWDNLAKVVSDALNGVAWDDDAQIVDGRSVKFYGEKPEIQVAIRRIK